MTFSKKHVTHFLKRKKNLRLIIYKDGLSDINNSRYIDTHALDCEKKLESLNFASLAAAKPIHLHSQSGDIGWHRELRYGYSKGLRSALLVDKVSKAPLKHCNHNIMIHDKIYEKINMVIEQEKDIYQQLIDIVPFIDPDTTRMIEWIWARRVNKGLNSYSKHIDEPSDSKVDFEKLLLVLSKYVDHHFTSDSFFRGFKIDKQNNVIELYILAEQASSNSIIICGDKDLVNKIYYEAKKLFVTNTSITVNSLMGFNSHGEISTNTKLVLSEQKLPTDQFYPWLTEGIDSFIEQYKKSASGVLVLIGDPGTGKTSFLKALMFKLNMTNNGLVTTDVASMDPSLMMWLSEKGNDSMIAFEDADNLVAHRKNGNTQMSGILNYAEGVISNNIKLIISTNLPSISEIDPALIRPGRAYRVLTFHKLTAQQANDARASVGLPELQLDTNKSYTLSEALNYVDEVDLRSRERRPMGFI